MSGTEKKYRILVIEDKPSNQESARKTLAGHEVTIISSFDEAMDIMSVRHDEENVARILAEAGFSTAPDPKASWEVWMAFNKAVKEAASQSIIPFEFDVVLTDMMMPASLRTLGPNVIDDLRKQVPYGFIIALRASMMPSVKFIAMVTDTNHHQGVMSAALDNISNAYYHKGFKPNFVINGKTVMFVHSPFISEDIGLGPCTWCKGTGVCDTCNGSGDFYGRICGCVEKVGLGICSFCKGTKQSMQKEDREDWGTVLRDLTGGTWSESELSEE